MYPARMELCRVANDDVCKKLKVRTRKGEREEMEEEGGATESRKVGGG